jgi:hypothetical protein
MGVNAHCPGACFIYQILSAASLCRDITHVKELPLCGKEQKTTEGFFFKALGKPGLNLIVEFKWLHEFKNKPQQCYPAFIRSILKANNYFEAVTSCLNSLIVFKHLYRRFLTFQQI